MEKLVVAAAPLLVAESGNDSKMRSISVDVAVDEEIVPHA
jgi:hypothetical protein